MTTLPYGTWPSPLSAAELFAGSVRAGDLVVDGGDVLWTEARPDDDGRVAVVRWRDGERRDVTPPGWSCRTRVHEYGGAPFAARDGVVVGAGWDDQRWYRLDESPPAAVTAGPTAAVPAPATRWADARILPGGGAMVAVRERHEGAGEPANEVVLVDLADGATSVLVTGRDFVSSPRPSPDGSRLAWLAWDHPAMPWDAAELWVGALVGDALEDVRRLTGGPGRSVCHPVWLDDDRVACSREDGERWRLLVLGLPADLADLAHLPERVAPTARADQLDPPDPTEPADRPDEPAVAGGATVRTLDLGGEVGHPAWLFGWTGIAPIGAVTATPPAGEGLVAVVTERAVDRVVAVDLGSGSDRVVDELADVVVVDAVQPFGDGVVLLGETVDGTQVVRVWSPTVGADDLATWPLAGVDERDVPVAEPVEVPTPDGATTHAMLFRPRLTGVVGPADERPPLLVHVHGGPTAWATAAASHEVVFWTSRGFAVAMVNYRGSSGFGQRYRDALRGRWGVLDAVDTMAVASGLAARGIVDGSRTAVRGGSAGGFTTLAVLTTPGHPFACGTSFFGVADLTMLAADTHKFESRYLDSLVGPLPEEAAVYRERSPINRTEHLSRPLLVLQGLEDEVVPPNQAEAIVAAAADRGIPHCYIPFEGEQHGFRRLENIVTWHESELAFYGEVMGFTPAGDLPDLDLSV